MSQTLTERRKCRKYTKMCLGIVRVGLRGAGPLRVEAQADELDHGGPPGVVGAGAAGGGELPCGMGRWLEEYGAWAASGVGVFILMAAATVVVVPMVIVRIPPDYYAHRRRPAGRLARRGPWVRTAAVVGKNALGYALIGAGLGMLVLPGQGLLTLLLGFLLIDVPGKYRMEKWVISRPRVLRAVNWLRLRRGREPLVVGAG